VLQEPFRARRLLPDNGELQRANYNSTPIEADHATDDNSAKSIFESRFDDNPTTFGACLHGVKHGDADAKLACLQSTA
jgi:hypothetical protein